MCAPNRSYSRSSVQEDPAPVAQKPAAPAPVAVEDNKVVVNLPANTKVAAVTVVIEQ